jgi:hypothetical protein
MAFLPSYNSRVLLGALNLSCQARDVSLSHEIDTHDVTTLCDTSRVYIPGKSQASFSASGPLDTLGAAGNPFAIFAAWTAAEWPITYAPRGLTTGYEALMVSGVNTSFAPKSGVGDPTDYSVSAIANGFDYGVMLEDGLTAITIDGNGTARDNAAATSNGGVAHLHVSAFSGLTNNIVTIEHSVDGSTSWSTLVTFATYTGVTSERVEVAAGTTVRRYLRVVDNVTGTGSTTRSVAFARR